MSFQKKFNRVMLTQPNYAWFGKRTWKLPPYGLGLLNSALKKASYESWIFDPNFQELSDQTVYHELIHTKPDIVGISSSSTEYIKEIRHMSQLVKEALPQAIVILGGILPTVLIEKAMEDSNIDYFIIGEGEYRLPLLLNQLNSERCDLSGIDGLAWGKPPVIQPMKDFITNLDDVEFPDYGNLDLSSYNNFKHKYTHYMIPRQFPFATTITSRGCPYRCIFCAAATVSGRKARLRSAVNVLKEIEKMYNENGVREVIFLDDHFLADRARAIDIMNGFIVGNYGMTWKCINVHPWHLDEELLELMRKSGCYQLTVSPESGNQHVLRKIIKKPGVLNKIADILAIAKNLDFEIVANFVIGFPGETWDQIRDTCRYAQHLKIDIVNFHIATPLPKTELMETSLAGGYLKIDDNGEVFGYTLGCIETPEFNPTELQILRAFEWDRINFSNPDRKAKVARMQGISMSELEEWRFKTRRNLGLTNKWIT